MSYIKKRIEKLEKQFKPETIENSEAADLTDLLRAYELIQQAEKGRELTIEEQQFITDVSEKAQRDTEEYLKAHPEDAEYMQIIFKLEQR